MANANIMAGSNRLKHALKALEEHWMATRETWNDSVRQRFEERHLRSLDRNRAPGVRGGRGAG